MEKPPSIEKQVIAEIGPGFNPVHKLFKNEIFEAIGKNSTYIAIDCDPEELKHFKDHFKEGYPVEGELRRLPLKNDSVDQMWLMNVFGGLKSVPQKLPDGATRTIIGFAGIFEELARVVKKNGKIYIVEIYPPIGNVLWLADKDYSNCGLEKNVYKGRDEVVSLLDKMGYPKCNIDHLFNERDVDYVPFFIELTKK